MSTPNSLFIGWNSNRVENKSYLLQIKNSLFYGVLYIQSLFFSRIRPLLDLYNAEYALRNKEIEMKKMNLTFLPDSSSLTNFLKALQKHAIKKEKASNFLLSLQWTDSQSIESDLSRCTDDEKNSTFIENAQKNQQLIKEISQQFHQKILAFRDIIHEDFLSWQNIATFSLIPSQQFYEAAGGLREKYQALQNILTE